jgi:hypothetical protein
MRLRHYYDLLTGKLKVEKPAKLTLNNVKAVIQSSFRSIDGIDLPQHLYEQIIWRRFEVQRNSPMCWQKGHCKVCGCDILGKTMEDRPCSIAEHPDLLEKRQPCYPAMMGEQEWRDYKILHKIKYFN